MHVWPNDLKIKFSKWAADPNWDFTSGFIFEEGSGPESEFAAAAAQQSIDYVRVMVGRAGNGDIDGSERYLINGLESDGSRAKVQKFRADSLDFGVACSSCGQRDVTQRRRLVADIDALGKYDFFRPDFVGSSNLLVVSRRLRELFEGARLEGMTFRRVLDGRKAHSERDLAISADEDRSVSHYSQLLLETSLHPLTIAKGSLGKPACPACGMSASIVLGWLTAFADPACLAGRDICALDKIALPDGSQVRSDINQIMVSGRLARILATNKIKGVIPFMRKPFKQLLRVMPPSSPIAPMVPQ